MQVDDSTTHPHFLKVKDGFRDYFETKKRVVEGASLFFLAPMLLDWDV